MEIRAVATRMHVARWLLPALAGLAAAVLVLLLGQTPGRAASAPLSISIAGNHFVDGSGQTIRLLGVNVSSSEYACADDDGVADDYYASEPAASQTASAIAAWGANVVRIPLNEDCWLNTSLPPGDPYGGDAYRQMVERFVSDLNARGIYAILDLHWTAPGNQTALEQQPMPDYAHSIDFWQSVATTFKSNPAVVFDVFNEPYDPTDPHSGDDANAQDKVTWNCWNAGYTGTGLNDPCLTQAYDDAGNPTTRYRIAGMGQLVHTIRDTGARQPVMVAGLDYANDLTQWVDHAPDDQTTNRAPVDQEAAAFHNYMGKQCDAQTCWDSTIAGVAANVPVVTGEFAEDNYLAADCNPGPGADSFDARYMNWADGKGVSYVSWVWLVDDPPAPNEDGCDRHGLLADYSGTPLAPNGTAVHDHLTALAAGGGAATTPTTPVAPTPAPTPAPTTTTVTPPPTVTRPKPAVALRSLRVATDASGSTAYFTLRSPQSATGTLTGDTASGRSHAHARPAPRRGRVTLGTAHFRLKANRSKRVALHLSPRARTLLRRAHSLRARMTITLTSPGHRRTVVHRTVTLRHR